MSKIEQLETKRNELRKACKHLERTKDGIIPLKTFMKGILEVAGGIFRAQKDEDHINNLLREIKQYEKYIQNYKN